jgi:hypothetical protein
LNAAVTPPVVLQVCRESRRIALAKLNGRLNGGANTQQRDIAFRSDLDTIYITRNLVSDRFMSVAGRLYTDMWSKITLATVHHLAIDARILQPWFNCRKGYYANVGLTRFHNLKSLTIVVHAWEWEDHKDCQPGWKLGSRKDKRFVLIEPQDTDMANMYLDDINDFIDTELVESRRDMTVDSMKVISREAIKVMLCNTDGRFCCEDDEHGI